METALFNLQFYSLGASTILFKWSLSNKDETHSILRPHASMVGPWDDDDLTLSGKWIRDHLNKIVEAPSE